MKSIYSLFQVCENVKVRKTNVNELIKTLKAEIYTASIQLHKAQNLNYYKDRFFRETFTQYAYEGDTLSVEGDEMETLTGISQIATKIVITYQLLP